jgi:hypothetical protein
MPFSFGGGGGGSGSGDSQSPTFISSSQLQLEKWMESAVHDRRINVSDLLAELRVALMDRMRMELKEFHDLDFGFDILIRQGHWFVQCTSHEYKGLVKNIANQASDDRSVDVMSREKLLRVLDELTESAADATEQSECSALKVLLNGSGDQHSQSMATFLLCCPRFLDALKASPDCQHEHTILSILGMGWAACDMSHLTDIERTRRLELVQALLAFNLGGEQIFLPFYDETNSGKAPGLKGILAGTMGPFTTQRLLALLSNASVRRQFRETYPEAYATHCERWMSNNDVESFFSEVATQMGYKPTLRNLTGRLFKIHFSMRMQFDPERRWALAQSRRKRYDPVEYFLAHGRLEWNDGTGLDPKSDAFQKFIDDMRKRAVASARGKFESIRSHNTTASNLLRRSSRDAEAPAVVVAQRGRKRGLV